MKLINRTKVADAVLRRVLLDAAHSLGKRLNTAIVVQVNPAQYLCRGVAYRARFVRDNTNRHRLLKTDSGWFIIRLPALRYKEDPLHLAESFFEVASHEWGHIRDFQHDRRCHLKNRHNDVLDYAPRVNGRRMAHCYRPEEKRVKEYLQQAPRTANDYAYSVIELAIEIERTNKK